MAFQPQIWSKIQEQSEQTFIGVLVDVSGSMKEALKLDPEVSTTRNAKRTHAIISVIVSIANQEAINHGRSDEVFIGAFGVNDDNGTGDFLTLLEKTRDCKNARGYENAYHALERLAFENHAPHAIYWIQQNLLDENEAWSLYCALQGRQDRIQILISLIPTGLTDLAGRGAIWVFGPRLTENAAAIKYAREIIREYYLGKGFEPRTLQTVADLLSKVFKETKDDTDDYQKLIDRLEKYIYGYTPMVRAVNLAKKQFIGRKADKKILFIVSDGESTDGDPEPIVRELREKYGITVATCYLTASHIDNQRSLHDKANSKWQPGERKLFEMSSITKNTDYPVTYLSDGGWQLPISGECRLFIRANNLAVVDEFSRTIVARLSNNCDALIDVIGKVDLGIFINRENANYQQPEQIGGTCYAHAVGAVFHLAMKRIVGCDGGVPSFESIRDRLTGEFGSNGYNTRLAIEKVAPEYRLRFKEVDEKGARKAINARRPVVARFQLTGEKWYNFSKFYRMNPNGTLTRQILDEPLPTNATAHQEGGHAVVLMRCDPSGLTFMNSWGQNWGDGGFFHVANGTIDSLQFFDVFWTIDDLRQTEKDAFRREAAETARKLGQRFPSVLSLYYECPSCETTSPIRDYTGHLLEAICPSCHHKFQPVDLSLMRSLYINSR